MYSERLLSHFKDPRNAGALSTATVVVRVENPACGDRLQWSVRVEEGRVVESAFQVRGCTASIACGSALTVWAEGRLVAEMTVEGAAAGVTEEVGGLPEASRHAAALCAEAVKKLKAG